jgi:hypothetical protein
MCCNGSAVTALPRIQTDDQGSQISRSVGAVGGNEVHVKREPSYDDFIMGDDMGTYVTCVFGGTVCGGDFTAAISDSPTRNSDSFV